MLLIYSYQRKMTRVSKRITYVNKFEDRVAKLKMVYYFFKH